MILIKWCGNYFLLARGQVEHEKLTAKYTESIKPIHW